MIGLRAGVIPQLTPEQLADITYVAEASEADGKGTPVFKLLSQALTGNSAGPSEKSEVEAPPLLSAEDTTDLAATG